MLLPTAKAVAVVKPTVMTPIFIFPGVMSAGTKKVMATTELIWPIPVTVDAFEPGYRGAVAECRTLGAMGQPRLSNPNKPGKNPGEHNPGVWDIFIEFTLQKDGAPEPALHW